MHEPSKDSVGAADAESLLPQARREDCAKEFYDVLFRLCERGGG